nr:hypothetical protein [Tanacetum cinerariifolium]
MYGKPSGVELQELVNLFHSCKQAEGQSKDRLAKDRQCHRCKEEGHWKRNCHVYLAELMKKRKKTGGQNVASTSLGLRGAKKLKHGSLYLYVVNGVRAKVAAIGSFDFVLPNGLVIILDNCHYTPSITRGVVLVHHLVDKGFTFGLSVSMNNILYFKAITVNSIYEINMRDSTLPIVNSRYSICNKRTKSNLEFTYLWHFRLAHINKKRIEKLQHDGLLKSADNELFDQCASCISGKMKRKPFSHKTEKVKDVLGLIHTDVCGPLRHVSKKAIQSDRGGEYISQEIKDYLKACGIVQQLTPLYTLQHNGVSERHNYTLLNMVRSMMSLATLPLSFWGYALESAARFLNMDCEAHVKRHTLDKLQQRYADFLEKDFILQKESGRIVELEDEDILPFENASEHPIKEESLALIVSQEEDVILVRRSVRTYKSPDRLCLNVEIDLDRLCFNVEVKEHSLGDLNEPANYKAALSDPEFEKWLVAMNAEMQSIVLDYEIWQMDVKTAFLNGFIEEEIYMEQPEDFIDPNHPWKVYLGEAVFILGIKIYRDRSRRLIGLSQKSYLDKILKRYRMDNSKRGSIPMQVDLYLSKSQCATTSAKMKHMQNIPYALAVGSIKYTVRCIRPDVAFAQNITSRFQQNIGEAHWNAVKNILKDDTQSQTGYKKAVWIRKFIDKLGAVPSNDYLIKMNCDNFATIIMAKESGIQKGDRHFKRKYHYVRECIETGKIDIVKVHTDDNLADSFTKALAGPKLTRHARSMGLRSASSFM